MIPEVSVLMTVYNDDRNDWLDFSIQSILTQSFGNFEFIIVDDCSTDGSVEVIKKYKKDDKRIKLIHTAKNVGLTKALNVGLSACDGNSKYVVRQDADDISHPQKIEKQLAIAENLTDVGIVGCWYGHINEEGKQIHFCKATPENLQSEDLAGSIAGGSPLIKFEVIEKLDGYDEQYYYAQDVDLWIRTRLAGWKLMNVPDVLYYWRVHPNQRTSKNRPEQVECAKKIIWTLLGIEKTKWWGIE